MRHPPFLGFEESDITDWSPRARVRGEMNPLPHAPRQHEPPDPARRPRAASPGIRTASTPAPLEGSLTSFACTQTIDRIVKEAAEGSIPPPTRSAGAARPKEDETPAACSRRKAETTNGPRGPLTPPCSRETAVPATRPSRFASASSPATRVIVPSSLRRSTTYSRKITKALGSHIMTARDDSRDDVPSSRMFLLESSVGSDRY